MDYIAFYSRYLDLQKRGKKYFALCPFHAESDPSFSIDPATGLFYCFGCGAKGNVQQFLQKMKKQGVEVEEKIIVSGLKKKTEQKLQKYTAQELENLYKEKTYFRYFDFYNNLLYTKTRFDVPKKEGLKSKTFIIEPSGVKSHFYNENRLAEAKDDKNTEIWFAEGEKCCDAVEEAMEEIEYNAVVLGFTNFRNELEALPDEAREVLKNRKFIIFEDNDDAGKKKVEEAVELLAKYALQIEVVRFKTKPEHYDIADFLAEGNSLSDALMMAERVYTDPISFIECGVVSSIIPEEEWILEPLIPNKTIILLDGLGGLGKSIFTMELCFAIATGKSFLMSQIKPVRESPILYLSAEETRFRFNERLRKIQDAYGYAAGSFFWLSTLSDTFKLNTTRMFRKENNQITPTEMADFIEKAIDRIKPKLVVLDSFINFYGLDENKTEEAANFYDYVKQIIKKHECSFLFIHHQTKEAMRGQLNIFRGSGVFREQARTRIVMGKKNGNKTIQIEKSNYYSNLLELFPIEIELNDSVWTIKGVKVQVKEEFNENGITELEEKKNKTKKHKKGEKQYEEDEFNRINNYKI